MLRGFDMNKLIGSITLLIFTMSISATASIVGGSVTGGSGLTAGGTFVKLTTPLAKPDSASNCVDQETFESYSLYGFDEARNFVLTAPQA